MDNGQLIGKLKKDGVLKSPEIEKALRAVDRLYYVPVGLEDEAYEDHPLPIGQGQTISQPTTVVFMLELLAPKAGDVILEIGAGSGWVTALLCELVGEKGRIYAHEINEKVSKFGQANLKRSRYKNFRYQNLDVKLNWQSESPYDKIISGAAFQSIDQGLIDLLKRPGRAVIPTADLNLVKIDKDQEGGIRREDFFGFVFVPLQ